MNIENFFLISIAKKWNTFYNTEYEAMCGCLITCLRLLLDSL